MTLNLNTVSRILLSTVGAALFAVGLVGCSQEKSSASGPRAPEGKPMRAPDKMGEAPAPQNQQTVSAQPTRTEPARKFEPPPKIDGAKPAPETTPAPTKKAEPPKYEAPPPAAPTPTPTPSTPAAGSDEERRSQAEDMIYATIRIKMEEAISERAKLLKEGRDPSDE